MRWGVVIAAGGEVEPELDAVLGVHRKAMAVIAGRTSLAHTLAAVEAANLGPCVTVTGAEIASEVTYGTFVPEGTSAVENAHLGLQVLGERVEGVLFLPADTPLLRADDLVRFTEGVRRRADSEGMPSRWYATGLSPSADFAREYPGVPFESLRLREGPHLSGALYACSRDGLVHILDLASAIRRSRKHQLKMLWKLGLWNLLRYRSGRITLYEAERILSRALGGAAWIDPTCHPSTCLDFDNAEDWHALVRLIENGNGPG